MDYVSYHSHVSIAMTYGVVIYEDTLFSIVSKFMNVYNIFVQNGRILIVNVLDKKNKHFTWTLDT